MAAYASQYAYLDYVSDLFFQFYDKDHNLFELNKKDSCINNKLKSAMAGNRTRINCLEGNYAHHYTTIARWYKTLSCDFTSREFSVWNVTFLP